MVLPSKVLLFNVRGKWATRVEKSGRSLCLIQKAAYWQLFCQTKLCGFVEACATFCTSASSTIGIARLFVVFATTHFLLDPSVLYELPKSLHCVLNLLPVSKSQLDHQTPLFLY